MSNTTATPTEVETSLIALQESANRFEQFAQDTLRRSKEFQLESQEINSILEKLKSTSIFK